MKYRFIFFLCISLLAGLVVGCMTGSSTHSPEVPILQSQVLIEGQLFSSDMAAMTVLNLARKGAIPENGPVRMAPGAVVELMNPEPGFTQTDSRVANVKTLQTGNVVVEVLRKFEDDSGRIQLMLDVAGYSLRQPTDQEVNANASALVGSYTAIMRRGSAEIRKTTQDYVRAFQQQAGLVVDGTLGPRTAETMAKSMGVQEFFMLRSAPAYPQSPKFIMHIMDEVLAKNDPDTYLKGFESLSAVSAKAISPERFAKRAGSGGSFLSVLYFMDQLPLGSTIQIGFSEYANRKDSDYKATMRPVYATGEGWSVVYAPFKLESRMIPNKLYALVLVNGSIVESVRLR